MVEKDQAQPNDTAVEKLNAQEAQVPPRYCDDRVSVLTADARLLDPSTWALHGPTVSPMQTCPCWYLFLCQPF